VVDRPGDWGSVFDRIILSAQTTGDLVVLNLSDGEEAYRATNEAILHEAQELCRADAQSAGCRQIAAVVWEGAARGDGDITEHFRRLATAAGFSERTIKAG
jgi:hypothetical protein